MNETKRRFVKATCSLLETQGYHATGMNQIIAESGAPKGSLYYHFPEGKEQLAEAAIELAGRNTAELILKNLATDRPIGEAVRDFVLGIARGVEVTNFQSGGPLTAVAMETSNSNQKLNDACHKAFETIQGAFEERLMQGGQDAAKAEELALFITASIEGAIILSRTHHSVEPLQTTANHLYQYLEGASA